MRAVLLALPLCLLTAPLAAQTTGQGTVGTGANILNPLGSRSLYPQGTVNPSLMPQPGGGAAVTGSQALPNPNGGLASGAATADGQQQGQSSGGGRGGGGGGGGGLAPGVTPVPSVGGGGRGGGSGGPAFTASSGGSGRGGGGASGNSNSSAAAVPSGHAAQWVLCPDDDSAIAAELGGGMSCAP